MGESWEGNLIEGRIIKIVAGAFTVVDTSGKTHILAARGALRHRETDLFVGDIVHFSDGAIEGLAIPRKNFFVRPYVANIDQIAVVVAPTPAPDRMLLDKLFIKSDLENIHSLLILNKCDLDENGEFEQSIMQDFETVVDHIVVVSARTGHNLKPLEAALAGKLTALAGQSAVGKSSLLNALSSDLDLKTNTLSARIERGKHTTRHSEIYTLDGGGFIADTPGFSMYKLVGVSAANLGLCYKDLFKFLPLCKYNMCSHTKEEMADCAVKRAVEDGTLSQGRYERYLKLFEELSNDEKNKY